MPRTDSQRSVFVNCPFDDEYLPLLQALLFAIHDCGFIARIALEDTGSSETRIDKIVRIVDGSRLSVHDISRVELSGPTMLPRFNMPFECGLAMGAIRFGPPAGRDFLLLAAEPFQDKKTLSDLAGQDPKYHAGDPRRMTDAIRPFLAAKKPAGERTRGAAAIWKRYQAFLNDLPRLSGAVEISIDEISSRDYLPDWLGLVAAWLLKGKSGRAAR